MRAVLAAGAAALSVMLMAAAPTPEAAVAQRQADGLARARAYFHTTNKLEDACRIAIPADLIADSRRHFGETGWALVEVWNLHPVAVAFGSGVQRWTCQGLAEVVYRNGLEQTLGFQLDGENETLSTGLLTQVPTVPALLPPIPAPIVLTPAEFCRREPAGCF